MRDADPIPDNQRELVPLHVQTAVVLHVGLIADANIVHIAADGGVRPDAGPLADNHITNHLSAGIHIGGHAAFPPDAAPSPHFHFSPLPPSRPRPSPPT